MASTCALAALTLGIAACGDDDESDDGGTDGGTASGEVTIYSSLPKQGASRPNGLATEQGMALAFNEAGNEAGGVNITFEGLDDATAQAGAWTPEAESANARRAAQDESAVLYLGTFNSGAAAISIPLLNEAGLGMISPANTAVGLTSDDPGADTEAGEPDVYYPTGERNYTRIVPKDTIQGAALAKVMEEDGCTTVAILNDKEVYGAGLATNIQTSLEELGLEVTRNDGIDPKAPNYRSLASDIESDGADCFVYSGITANNAVQLYKDVAATVPDAKLYGPDGVAESTFYNPGEGGLPADIASRVKVSVATLDPNSYSEEGQKFFEDFEAEYNEPNPNPYAIYGYEAAQLALDALERAEDPTDRASVIEALFATEDRDSVLGTYSIDENGDTTLTDYGIYTIKDGELAFEQKVEAAE
ncbi:MAG: branched-chain amino acid ABC transporter substrate-binding protein [Actinomycetota bacterium]|nr:branched-chain amino acid ABC transporter substrate-binding protein [Actinomycetota bacterium]